MKTSAKFCACGAPSVGLVVEVTRGKHRGRNAATPVEVCGPHERQLRVDANARGHGVRVLVRRAELSLAGVA